MGIPTLVSVGTGSDGAGNVVSPTTLTPTIPATRANGDTLVVFTSCTTNAATATCSTAGWYQAVNISLTNGRIYLFACPVDGSETSPSIVWSGMTTGVSGTPVMSDVACFRSLINPVVVDVQGSTSNQASSATLAAGGGSAVASDVNSLLLTMSVRSDDVGTWQTLRPAGGLVWQPVSTQSTTSGADAAQHWQWSVTGNPITVGAQTFTLTGGTSVVSSGVQVALSESQALSTLAPPAFSPPDLAGLGVWCKADAGTSTTTDGVAVSQWDDQSGNARHLVQATGAKQPLYKTAILNGLPVVRFDGVDDILNAAFTQGQPATFFVVVAYRSAYTVDRRVFDSGVINVAQILGRQSATLMGIYAGTTVVTVTTTPQSFHVYTAIFNGASSQIAADGGAATVGNIGTGRADGLTIGGQHDETSAQCGDIDVAELVMYDGALSATDRQNVETYLKGRWATP